MAKLTERIFEFILVSICFAILGMGTAHADISDEDFQFYLDNSYSRHWDPGESKDIETEFYLVAVDAEIPQLAIKTWAKQKELSELDAEAMAIAFIESVKFEKTCRNNGDQDPEKCLFSAGHKLFDSLNSIGMSDQSGEVAIIIGKALGSGRSEGDVNIATFINVIKEHPSQEQILQRLARYSGGEQWVLALAFVNPKNIENAIAVYHSSGYLSSRADSSRVLAVLESASMSARKENSTEAALIYAQSLMLQLCDLGLNQSALELFENLSADQRAMFFTLGSLISDEDKKYIYENQIFELGVNIAASYIESSKRKRSELILDSLSSIRLRDNHWIKNEELIHYKMVQDAMSQSLSGDELYEMYMHGHLSGEPNPRDENPRDDANWLHHTSNASPIVREVVSRRLQGANLPELGRYVTSRAMYYRRGNAASSKPDELFNLPKTVIKRKAYWNDKIEDAWQNWKGKYSAPDQVDVPSNVLAAKIMDLPQEIPLSTEFQREDCGDRGPPEQAIPSDANLPVNPRSIIRYEIANGRQAIIYLSADLDRPGEIPAFGYWFQSTNLMTGKWEPPVYLGLQRYFPYKIRRSSRVPMISPNNKLNIEVDIKEIDPASITFPPVGLEYRREECNVYISMSLEELKRDSDSDGLSDLVETRIGLDPNNRDTDGDELSDGRDALPLTTYSPTTPKIDNELAIAILSEIVGIERGAIMVGVNPTKESMFLSAFTRSPEYQVNYNTIFLVGDPELFAGIRLPVRLVVYTPSDIKKLPRGAAPFYPIEVRHIFTKPDGSEKYVIWSASWTGGEFIVRCNENKCETQVVSHWIS